MKRPLLGIMVAYVSGIICYRCKSSHLYIIILIIYICLGLLLLSKYFVIWKDKNKKASMVITLILPICFVLGYLRMNQQTIKTPLENFLLHNMEATFTGAVDEIGPSKNGITMIITDVQIKFFSSNTTYHCKRAIVSTSTNLPIKAGNSLSIHGSVYPLLRATNPGQFDSYQYYKAKDISFSAYAKEIQITNSKVNFLKQGLYDVKLFIKQTYDQILPKQEAGILDAMLLGDKTLLTEEIKDLYQKNGISHILAISGLHMSFFGLSLYKLLRKAKCSLNTSTIITVILIVLYGILTNNSVSTKRAICMLILLLFSTIVGKTYDILSAISFSSLILLIESPMQLYQTSFQLSFGAILGIAIIYPVLRSMILREGKMIEDKNSSNKDEGKHKVVAKVQGKANDERKEKEKEQGYQLKKEQRDNKDKKQEYNKENEQKSNKVKPKDYLCLLKKYLCEGLAVSLSVQLITLPIIACSYFEFSPYSILLNLFVLPFMAILFPLAALGAIIFPLSIEMARFVVGGAYYILKFFELLCISMDKLPFHLVLIGKPDNFQIFLYYLLLLFLIKFSLRYSYRLLAFLFMLTPFILIYKVSDFSLTLLDVGQGECIVIQNDNGNAYMMDGGSTDIKEVGEQRIIPYLKSKQIKELDCVIITHGDFDHISGIIEILTDMEDYVASEPTKKGDYNGSLRIKTLCLPITAKSQEYINDYLGLIQLADKKGVNIVYFSEGGQIKDHQLIFTSIAPEKEKEYSDINAHSQIFYLRYGEFDALLTGDTDVSGLEHAKKILEQNYPATHNIELYKVAHHGSKYSIDLELFEYLNPLESVISSGRFNQYGHPHEETIKALENTNTRIHQTKENGAIIFYSNGKQYIVKHYLE